MKRRSCFFSVLAAGLLAAGIAGCKKAPPPPPQSIDQGVAQLRTALATANADVRRNLYEGVNNGIRYDNYMQSMVALDKIINDPSLTEQQKKVANDLMALLKQKVQAQQPAPQAK